MWHLISVRIQSLEMLSCNKSMNEDLLCYRQIVRETQQDKRLLQKPACYMNERKGVVFLVFVFCFF